MRSEEIGEHLGGPGGTPVNTRIRICVDCGSARISISESDVRCKSCGARHRRRDVSHLKFKPGDLVRIIDAGKDTGPTYKIEKVSQYSGGIRYILRSKSSRITLSYIEGPESRLESVTG